MTRDWLLILVEMQFARTRYFPSVTLTERILAQRSILKTKHL